VEIAENVGDALTFLVLTDDSHIVLPCCDVRPDDDPLDPNQRADVRHVPDASADRERESKIVLSTDGKVHEYTPSNIVGLTYLQECEVDGSLYCAKNI
jgi:hypothetical protein